MQKQKKKKFNILADENMPLVSTLFAEYGNVKVMPGRHITSKDLESIDVLLVRSVTKIDEKLLRGTKVRYVGSATSGIDHLDVNYLNETDIKFDYAPGCNALAVAEYSLSAMSVLCENWTNKKVSVIGCGNVGSKLIEALTRFRVSCNYFDPFVERKDVPKISNFNHITQSDILCFHTPLIEIGEFPTKHLVGREQLESLKPNTIIINAGRGAVISNKALLEFLKARKSIKVALDVWENEPDIDLELLDLVDIGTPHIAGNTVEGKLRGTQMLHQAFKTWCGFDDRITRRKQINQQPEDGNFLYGDDLSLVCLNGYDIRVDNELLKETFKSRQNRTKVGEIFDLLRKNYRRRNEYLHTYIM